MKDCHVGKRFPKPEKPQPSSTQLLAPTHAGSKHMNTRFLSSLMEDTDKRCAQRYLYLQGVDTKIPKPDYQMNFISSWHMKHPLATATPVRNSLQFLPPASTSASQ